MVAVKILKNFKRMLAALVLVFVADTAHAQFDYLSASRSVWGYARINPAAYPSATSYSGDFSGSAAPSSPFADFGANWGGTATLAGEHTNPDGSQTPYQRSAFVSVSQTSSLHLGELYYSSREWTGYQAEPPSSPVDGNGFSSLQVTFSVSAPVTYDLSCLSGSPYYMSHTYTLSSINQGVFVDSHTDSNWTYGKNCDYVGVFNPGDIYTLSLFSEDTEGAGLRVSLVAVPEPSPIALSGLALLLVMAWPLVRSRSASPMQTP